MFLVNKTLRNTKSWNFFSITRTYQGISQIQEFSSNTRKSTETYDCLVLGGGIMGCSVAFFLKRLAPELNVCIIERDKKYEMSSTTLSAGGFRQQFSVRENIEMSMFSNRFFKNINEELESDNIDLQIYEEGYLTVSTNKTNTENLKANISLQRELGASTELLSPIEIKAKFPWMNTSDIQLGIFGPVLEGWMDPYSLLFAFKTKCSSMGVKFIESEIVSFSGSKDYIIGSVNVVSKENEKHEIKGHAFINCCGAWSGYINELMSLYAKDKENIFQLPVVPKKRNVFVVKLSESDAKMFSDVPLIFDSSGLWMRRDGRQGSSTFLVGKAPPKENDPSFFWKPRSDESELVTSNLSYQTCQNQLLPDFEIFEDYYWEDLANRIPAFEACKVINAWAGFYDYNLLDQNAIIGKHLYLENVFVATGFSGHGIQQSPSVGLAIAEQFVHKKFMTLDLSRFGLQRIRDKTPLLEKNCY